jgi:hypothetical protein
MAGVNRFKTVSWENYLNNGFYFLIMRKNTKSQAAMEFLMTYGWALLVVLIVIAALAYFGLLNPSRFLPDRVDLSPGLEVRTASVDENSIIMIIQNNMGKPLFNLQINATECNGSRGVLSDPIHLPDGKTERIIINCGDTSPVGSKFNSNLRVNYSTRTLSNTLTHSRTGKIVVTVNTGETSFPVPGECIADASGFYDGSGTAQDPYGICNCTMLQKMNESLSSHYYLVNDIDCSDTRNWNDGKGFRPVGYYPSPVFNGKLDGKNNIITDLFINRSSGESTEVTFIALFGYAGSGSKIKDLGIENAYIIGHDFTATLVGLLVSGTISNCYSSGNIVSTGSHIGGLVGKSTLGFIEDSYSTGSVYTSFDDPLYGYVGGLIGTLQQGTLNNTYSRANTTGLHHVGGLAGYVVFAASRVRNSYSTGKVEGSTNTGGLIGLKQGGTVTNSYWDIDSSGMAASAAGTGVNEDGEEPEYFYNLSQPVYTSTEPYWDFDTVWSNSNNMTGYPILKWQE